MTEIKIHIFRLEQVQKLYRPIDYWNRDPFPKYIRYIQV